MFKHPSYARKCYDLCCNPAGQLIRGIMIETRGWPNLSIPKQPDRKPSYYLVKTLKAGKK
jgi:hypothetical protein